MTDTTSLSILGHILDVRRSQVQSVTLDMTKGAISTRMEDEVTGESLVHSILVESSVADTLDQLANVVRELELEEVAEATGTLTISF